MARPKSSDPMVPIPSRLPSSLAGALNAVARAKGITESELVRTYVEEGLRRHLKTIDKEIEREQARQRAELSRALEDMRATGSAGSQPGAATAGPRRDRATTG